MSALLLQTGRCHPAGPDEGLSLLGRLGISTYKKAAGLPPAAFFFGAAPRRRSRGRVISVLCGLAAKWHHPPHSPYSITIPVSLISCFAYNQGAAVGPWCRPS